MEIDFTPLAMREIIRDKRARRIAEKAMRFYLEQTPEWWGENNFLPDRIKGEAGHCFSASYNQTRITLYSI